jgi:hypothetical protein
MQLFATAGTFLAIAMQQILDTMYPDKLPSHISGT